MERHEFDAAYARICEVCGMKTQTELSAYLGIRQSSISDAKRRGKISSGWLVILMRVKNVHPEWILTRTGPCFMVQPIEDGHYETGAEFTERQVDEEALRRLPSRKLADELVRRIAVSQEKIALLIP